jgi:hypothetical protein
MVAADAALGLIEPQLADRHSRAFATALLAAHPAWRAHARIERWPDLADWFLVEIPPPVGADLAGPLEIEAAHGDVTVFFDHGRAHFTIDAERPGSIARVLGFIADILAGDLLCLSEIDGGQACDIHLLRRDRVAATGLRPPPGRGRQIRIRSWRGDADIDLPGRVAA